MAQPKSINERTQRQFPVHRETNMPHQVIFLNGPRHSGKDTAANFIYRDLLSVRLKKFAEPLKNACAALYCVPPDLLRSLEAVGSSCKTQPMDIFFGKSWVEALIDLAEEYFKPLHGDEVFGIIATNSMRQATGSSITVFSDSGSGAEALPVIDAYGPKNCHVFQLFRDGCNFNGDSRNYWKDNRLTLEIINNNHELDMFRIQILSRVYKIIGKERNF